VTNYIILRQNGEGEWQELGEAGGTIIASSARSAIRAMFRHDQAPGTFVAVPARNFQPLTVNVKTEQRVVFS